MGHTGELSLAHEFPPEIRRSFSANISLKWCALRDLMLRFYPQLGIAWRFLAPLAFKLSLKRDTLRSFAPKLCFK